MYTDPGLPDAGPTHTLPISKQLWEERSGAQLSGGPAAHLTQEPPARGPCLAELAGVRTPEAVLPGVSQAWDRGLGSAQLSLAAFLLHFETLLPALRSLRGRIKQVLTAAALPSSPCSVYWL